MEVNYGVRDLDRATDVVSTRSCELHYAVGMRRCHLQIIHPHRCLVTLSWCRHSVAVCNWKHNFICRWHDNLCKFWKGSSIKWNYEMSQLLSELNSISHQSVCNQYCHIQPFDHGFATPSSPLLGNKESHTQKNCQKNSSQQKNFLQCMRKCSTLHQVELFTVNSTLGTHDFSLSDADRNIWKPYLIWLPRKAGVRKGSFQ